MVQVGRRQTLEVVKKVAFGLYLDGDQFGEILLPKNDVPDDARIGDFLDVLIYSDSEDRLIATTKPTAIQVDEFAYLTCVDVNAFGAFFDWGLSKDLCVPKREQASTIEVGKRYVVHAYTNKGDNRVVGSTKYERFLDDLAPHKYKAGEAVSILITRKTELGYKVIVDDALWGMLYADNVFGRVYYGERRQAFIQRVREDGKLDITLQVKRQAMDGDKQKILNHLTEHGGRSHLHDGVEPDEIKRVLGLSKKAFKRALGKLLAENQVRKESDGIALVTHD